MPSEPVSDYDDELFFDLMSIQSTVVVDYKDPNLVLYLPDLPHTKTLLWGITFKPKDATFKHCVFYFNLAVE